MTNTVSRLEGISLPGGHAQLSERVRLYLRELIVSGRVSAGEFLRLDPLAEALGISTTPVREALLGLASEGFVKLRPRLGFEVLPITPDDIVDIFAIQAFLAGELAARAASRLSDEDLTELSAIQRRWEQAVADHDLEEVSRLNHEFHRLINLAAGAPKYELFLQSAARFAPRVLYSDIEGWRQATPKSHRAIIRALSKRDPEASRKAMAEHIEHAGKQLSEHLQSGRAEPKEAGNRAATNGVRRQDPPASAPRGRRARATTST